MRRPAPEIQAGKLLLAGALLLTASCGLAAFAVIFSAAAKGPVAIEAAEVGGVLPTHSVEMEKTPAGLVVAGTNESLGEFRKRLLEVTAAGMEPPAALLRVGKTEGASAVLESVVELKKAGFSQVFLAVEAER